MSPMMIGRARRHIRRLLRHTYTRVPKVAQDVVAALDEYGVPTAPASAAAAVPNVRCLYEDNAGTLMRTDHGVELVTTPVLYVAYDDPLRSGDEVRDIIDPRERRMFVVRAIAELPTHEASGGPQVYQTMRLREIVMP